MIGRRVLAGGAALAAVSALTVATAGPSSASPMHPASGSATCNFRDGSSAQVDVSWSVVRGWKSAHVHVWRTRDGGADLEVIQDSYRDGYGTAYGPGGLPVWWSTPYEDMDAVLAVTVYNAGGAICPNHFS